jgi:hypothetical protein
VLDGFHAWRGIRVAPGLLVEPIELRARVPRELVRPAPGIPRQWVRSDHEFGEFVLRTRMLAVPVTAAALTLTAFLVPGSAVAEPAMTPIATNVHAAADHVVPVD